MRNKIHALIPSERAKFCDHQGASYGGGIPCTGPIVCHMCGGKWNSFNDLMQEQTLDMMLVEYRRICRDRAHWHKLSVDSGYLRNAHYTKAAKAIIRAFLGLPSNMIYLTVGIDRG